MKKNHINGLLFAVIALALTIVACDDDDDETVAERGTVSSTLQAFSIAALDGPINSGLNAFPEREPVVGVELLPAPLTPSPLAQQTPTTEPPATNTTSAMGTQSALVQKNIDFDDLDGNDTGSLGATEGTENTETTDFAKFLRDNNLFESRSVFSFDISSIPPGATIELATVNIFQRTIVGNPYGLFGFLFVDHIDVSGFQVLESALFDGFTLEGDVGVISTDALAVYKQLDVTTQVQNDLDAGRSTSAFRVRVQDEAANLERLSDGRFHVAVFTDSREVSFFAPVLEIVYDAPEDSDASDGKSAE